MIQISDNGIIIRLLPFKDSDLIVTLITQEHGKISCLAKGARNSKKRFSGGLDLFNSGIFAFSKGKGSSSLYILEGLDRDPPLMTFSSSLLKLTVGSFFLETLHLFIEEGNGDGQAILPLIKNALYTIDQTTAKEDILVTSSTFLIQFLKIEGYDPNEHPTFKYIDTPQEHLKTLIQFVTTIAEKKINSSELLLRLIS